ncbi:hypothetical protein RSOLAG22IIIB_09224 [Rhizoctonia solani]|uniref:J domain-containing protein n=1 Tax=Rhizoctonia solani TaxID=456999 RepID=A0A0K6FXG1_9AGAM|nr:hypothetical protein RSOLAG22IIIB_09224 [Rhizoctonia solani]
MDWLGQLAPYSSFAYRTLAWWFLPNMATSALLRTVYQLLPPFGLSHWVPSSESPKRLQHYRFAFALVVLSYLGWSLVQSLLEQPPSFYSLLGVDISASDGEIKSAYRNFARRNHPDRVGPAGEHLFIQVRDAYEALKHPIKRYGYDRFGFDALDWKVAENPHAMLWQGLESAMRYYLPTGVAMLVMAIMGWGGTSSYWRHIAWALVASLEACVIIGFNPLAPYLGLLQPIMQLPIWESLIPSFAPYQWTFFLRETFVSVAVAIGVVVPVVFPPPPTKKEELERQAEIARLAIGLHPVVRDIIVQSAISDIQAKELVQREIQYLDMAPFPPSLPTEIRLSDAHRAALASLAPTLQRLVVQQALLGNESTRSIYLEALGRTSEVPKQEEPDSSDVTHNNALTDRMTPAPEDINYDGLDDLNAARLLAIPSPPSSIFSPSRDVTPEPSYSRTFDVNTPGFNWRSSPSGTPTPNRATSAAAAMGGSSSSPLSKGARRPSLSPSKRPSRLTEAGFPSPTSPVSPVMLKGELA